MLSKARSLKGEFKQRGSAHNADNFTSHQGPSTYIWDVHVSLGSQLACKYQNASANIAAAPLQHAASFSPQLPESTYKDAPGSFQASVVHYADHSAHHFCCLPLTEMALVCNAVKQLPTLTTLHDQVHVALVLVGALQLHDVWVPRQMQQNLDFPLHVLNVIRGHQLPLGYRLAGIRRACGLLVYEVHDAEVALAEHLVEHEVLPDCTCRNGKEHRWSVQN
eukprot:1147374-Pelagomonas_calceolata.AAC.3